VPAPPSSSSSSSETTLQHIKHSWNSVLPHKKEKRRSKSYEQLVSKKRFWQREPANSPWVLVIGGTSASRSLFLISCSPGPYLLFTCSDPGQGSCATGGRRCAIIQHRCCCYAYLWQAV
jgi:hypothetical protein